VTSSYPARYSSAAERELWWQTGYHHLRSTRTLPALEASESRQQLGALARFVFADPEGDGDIVIPLSVVLARATEQVVMAELARRAIEVSKLITSLHPFYRNAGLSLNEAFAARTLSLAKREKAAAVFAQDWADAMELESTARSALDALESTGR
jgi:GNAT superfamily N-acetyltransferase